MIELQEMKLQDIQELLQAYSWFPVASKKISMYSFLNEMSGARLNYYVTTGTFTIDTRDGKCHVFRDIETLEELEKILL